MNNKRSTLLAAAVASLLSLGTAHALPVNFAPTGVATQSTIDPGGGHDGVASRGIDGNRDGNFFHGSVTHTANGDPDPRPGLFEWWEVTFGQAHSFDELIVFNRTDCCIDRINPFRLSVFNGTTSVFSVDVSNFVSDISGPGISGMTFQLGGQVGNRVRVQLAHQDYLSLAEVEAYASAVPESSTLALLGAGLACLAVASGLRRRA